MKEMYYNPSPYMPELFSSLADNIKDDRTPEDLLLQVMLDLGILLSSKIEESVIDGKKVFNVEDNYLIACFDDNVTDAVESIVNVFNGQGHYESVGYIRDLGKVEKNKPQQTSFATVDEYDEEIDLLNEAVELTDEQLLANIHKQQTLNNIKLSSALVKEFGRCALLDVEMETGTGKTYVL